MILIILIFSLITTATRDVKSTSLNVAEDIGNFSYGFTKELFQQMNEINASVCVSILPLIFDGVDQVFRIINNKANVRAYLKLSVDVLFTIERSVLNCGTIFKAMGRVVNMTLQDFTPAYWTYLNMNILKVLAKLAPLIKNIRNSIAVKDYYAMGKAFGDVYYLLFINIRPPVKFYADLNQYFESIIESWTVENYII